MLIKINVSQNVNSFMNFYKLNINFYNSKLQGEKKSFTFTEFIG